MDQIPGIDLAALQAECEQAYQKQRKEGVRKHVQSLFQRIATQRASVDRITGELSRAKAVLDSYLAEMARIQAGDWSVIPSPEAAASKQEAASNG